LLEEGVAVKLSIGSKITVEAKTGTEITPDGERLILQLDFYTPWGPPIRNVTEAPPETMRKILVWLRSNYGMMAYDFVAARSSITKLLGKNRGEG
jgi:hypothetical protein